MALVHFYRHPGVTEESRQALLRKLRYEVASDLEELDVEICFNVDLSGSLDEREESVLEWLFRETFLPDRLGRRSFLSTSGFLCEVGPRLTFTTAWSTNAVSICHSCALYKVRRIERSRRYRFTGSGLDRPDLQKRLVDAVHDRMTECPYPEPLRTFSAGIKPEKTKIIPVLEEGRKALERLNREAGLAFDDWDLDYYTRLFREVLKRNPTDVECYDIAQSNSEHSRHWFFKGRLILDGEEKPNSLLELVQEPWRRNPGNSTIAFRDNSSAIEGFRIRTLLPHEPGSAASFTEAEADYDLIFTAETHNFPSGVAPFPGAETGTGGRIRDVHATGRGSLVVAGTTGYCVGQLRLPGAAAPWEDPTFLYPANLASPVQIEIEASNGASDYGNKFGEPVLQGFTRSFGLRLPDGERREWIKPIMFSGGIGQLDARHREKGEPEPGMLVVKIGGPAYRIGMGGGAASSMVQGENVAELDFNAVQRGDAEMEQKVNRVIRACVELGDRNPIVSIHDQGAGGNCNVLKELVSPAGAGIELRKIIVGDETLSPLEIWVAEYQEQDALLLREEHAAFFEDLCRREKVPVAFVGRVTGDGRIVVYDELDGSTPVNLQLDHVLGKMPRKVFYDSSVSHPREPLRLPPELTVKDALERVLRVLSVGSKRFLTNKVDRSVTGLVVRQPCAGPLQLTVGDVAVIAQTHFGVTGGATAVGEQPIIGLLDPAAMARMSVAEALTNLVWARITRLEDVKCSANWMWAAKLPGEGAAVYRAAEAVSELMIRLGIAIDGGKDSLSMAAHAPLPDGKSEIVKAPGSLVISAYAPCPDIRCVVTPDLKRPGKSELLFIDLAGGKTRLGGSSLAYAWRQVGDTPPDVDDPDLLARAFQTVQELVGEGLILSGHDRSDGGLITTCLETAFAGNCGLELTLPPGVPPLPYLFAEESGLVIEIAPEDRNEVGRRLSDAEIPWRLVGRSRPDKRLIVRQEETILLDGDVCEWRDVWEETSYHLELLQANPSCVEEERCTLRDRSGPPYRLTFDPSPFPPLPAVGRKPAPKVAVLREEGSNGDREMASAFHLAGFEVWDVMMTDLLHGRIRLDDFRGIAFVGGFSYADVLDSAKGWAAVIRFHAELWEQFQAFYRRPDTFSFGICNGCQLMALLGWVPWPELPDARKPRFIQNRSGRFESRFSTLRVEPSPAVMLDGMEGSILGVWVAHGEGRAHFPEASLLDQAEQEHLIPVRFVDDRGEPTECYPFNPNGSPRGIAGLCSPDGRHLAMMPHPERTFLKWQWPWMPETWREELPASPWLRLFENARRWCERTS